MLTGAVFEGMDWGTEKVFQQQCDRAEELGISLLILHTELSDVVSITDYQLYHYIINIPLYHQHYHSIMYQHLPLFRQH